MLVLVEFILRYGRDLMSLVRVLDIIQKLSQLKYITDNQINKFRRSRPEHNEELLESLLDEITLVQFLEALFKAKYHESALGLAFIYRQKMLMRASDTGPGFQQGQKLYFDTKRNLQENIFKEDPSQQCEKTYQEMKKKYEEYEKMFEEEENEDTKKKIHLKMKKYAYICTSCLCVALDAEITRWNTSFYWVEDMVPKSRLQRLLSELNGFINKTQNPLIVQVGLFSRIAIAYAMTGQLAKAEDYIENAFALSIYIPKCTEVEFMFHMYIMILLSKYQEDPTELLLKKFLRIVECGLRNIQDEADESKRYFWMRMILLRKVFLLLGLGNKMEVINGWVYKEEYVNKAEELLVEIYQMGNMEKRREMFFYMAKARFSELQNSLEFGVDNIRMAIDCDELKCYGETENAKEYKEILENKIGEQQKLTLRHTVDGPNSQECTTPVYSTCHSEITIPKRID